MAALSLEGRVALITGAASGIGEAAARMCVARGARVFLVDRDETRLAAVGASLGSAAFSRACDVGEADGAARYVTAALKAFGRIDIGLLNAGIAGPVARIQDVTPDAFDEVMRINVRGVWSGMAALFPPMQAAGGGSIVVTASTGGVLGAPLVAPYIASKHAVIGLVKSAALEGARHGIRVNALAPAPIDTPMMAAIGAGLGRGDADLARQRTLSHLPMKRYGTPEEAARMLVFLGSDESSYCTGGVYLLDGGLAAGIVS